MGIWRQGRRGGGLYGKKTGGKKTNVRWTKSLGGTLERTKVF